MHIIIIYISSISQEYQKSLNIVISRYYDGIYCFFFFMLEFKFFPQIFLNNDDHILHHPASSKTTSSSCCIVIVCIKLIIAIIFNRLYGDDRLPLIGIFTCFVITPHVINCIFLNNSWNSWIRENLWVNWSLHLVSTFRQEKLLSIIYTISGIFLQL